MQTANSALLDMRISDLDMETTTPRPSRSDFLEKLLRVVLRLVGMKIEDRHQSQRGRAVACGLTALTGGRPTEHLPIRARKMRIGAEPARLGDGAQVERAGPQQLARAR